MAGGKDEPGEVVEDGVKNKTQDPNKEEEMGRKIQK
jgi:hypothetical protein